MINGTYPLLSGGLALEAALETVTNNLANSSTTGFKRDMALYETYVSGSDPAATTNTTDYVVLNGIVTDLSEGMVKRTGNDLDVALAGQGFFVVQLPDGNFGYTRSGNFSVNSNNELVTKEGRPVMGQSGKITVGEGDLDINRNGVISSNKVEAGRLKLVTFDDSSTLVKLSGSVFVPGDSTGEEQVAGDIEVIQGSLELSNVNTMTELTEMIRISRAYETYQRLIQSLDTTESQSNTLGAI